MTDNVGEGNKPYGKYNDYDNVYDFTEWKLHDLIDVAVKNNREDIAVVLLDALDKYMLDEIDIVFVDGWPHIHVQAAEDNET